MKAMEEPQSDKSSALRRWGPLAAVAAVALLVVGFLVTSGGDDGDDTASPETTGVDDTGDLPPQPEGVLSFSRAEAEGTVDDVDWGERCDTETGVLALPLSPPPECYAPFDGDNGGATATGVTADSIKVVVYTPQADDPVLKFVYGQVGADDSPADTFATYEGYNELFARYYETYGRSVELVQYEATGNIGDDVAATADAETIARDIQPFAVIGGPLLTNAFADTLAANQILCMSCTPGQPNEWYVERGPYVWDIAKNSNQNQIMVAEYIGKRVGNRPAQFGGDEVNGKDRQIGYVYLSTGPNSEDLRAQFEENLGTYDVELAEVVSFTDPVALGAQARDIMARFKDRGITTVLYSGDPLAPQSLTEAATSQDYFPEWVITGSALVDTTVFARTYDPEQWRHAFGPSNLFARISPKVAGSQFLYEWYFGEETPAQQAALIAPNLQFLYGILQGAGPDLSPETFQNTIFNAPIIESTVISPQISWGNRDIWPQTDYAGLDDQTEVWWDPEATGVDELGQEGTGMWAYVDGGTRYLPGEWPEGDPDVFDPDGAVTLYTDLPDGITLPSYEPLPPN